MILDQHEIRRRRILRLKSAGSDRLLIGPERVHFRLTDLCNLTCQYCWEYGPNNNDRPSGKNHLPFEVFKGVVRDCAELNVDRIELSGIGDPTLHPRFYDMLDCIKEPFTTTIFTNGTFPIDHCRDILKADHVVINIGEANRKGYLALQGRDLFIKVIKNIKELARLRPKINPAFRLEVVFVETAMNTKSFSDTETLVRKLGADSIRKTVFEVSEHNRHLSLPGHKESGKSAGEWIPCYHGWFDSAIRLNGDVNVCAFCNQLTIGNVLEKSFKDIWESQEYFSARFKALKGEKPFQDYHECINCRAVARNKDIDAQWEIYGQKMKT